MNLFDDTPPAKKKKMRIAGAWVAAGAVIDLAGLNLPIAYRPISIALLFVSAACLLVAVVYMLTARKAA